MIIEWMILIFVQLSLHHEFVRAKVEYIQSEARLAFCKTIGQRKKIVIGPSGVRALPSAAGINEGGHYGGQI